MAKHSDHREQAYRRGPDSDLRALATELGASYGQGGHEPPGRSQDAPSRKTIQPFDIYREFALTPDQETALAEITQTLGIKVKAEGMTFMSSNLARLRITLITARQMRGILKSRSVPSEARSKYELYTEILTAAGDSATRPTIATIIGSQANQLRVGTGKSRSRVVAGFSVSYPHLKNDSLAITRTLGIQRLPTNACLALGTVEGTKDCTADRIMPLLNETRKHMLVPGTGYFQVLGKIAAGRIMSARREARNE